MQRGNSQRRTVLRAVSLIIIVGTIPVYFLLIGAWLFMPQNGPSTEGPTFTPLNADFLTQQDATQPAFATQTFDLGGTYTYFTPNGGGINLSSPTPPPTRYIPPTAAPTSAVTNTLPPTPVIAPTDVILPPTQPPLIPPTDTPTA